MFPGFVYKHPYPQAMPPQMKMGTSNSPYTHETWPHHHGYPVPTPCHSCCNQNPYSNYYPYMPHPYTHLPTPTPLHPQYYYPVYPEPHPFHYAPPHHYTMELPKYEYDKTIPHCHGCNDHSKDQGVKIEEHEPQDQSREGAINKPVSNSTKLRGDGERDSKLSGWMPLDMENLIRLLQNGKLTKDEDDQPKDQVHQMPFPVVWLPYNNEEKGKKSIPAVGAEDKNGENLSAEKRDKPPRIAAVKHEDDEPKSQIHQIPFPMVVLPCNNEEKGQQSIPADKTGEKASVEKSDKPLRTIPVKQLDKEDDSKTGRKSKPSSPTKASKLPPVCLRIDPLPKKKNGEGKSRSPSPPRDKVQQVEVVKPSSSSSSSSVAEKDNAAEVSKPSRLAGNDSEAKLEAQKAKEKISEKKMLSGEEAATIIQSVYRGYEVRRWEPLKKMKQIAKIQEEAAALKKCIEDSVDSMDLKQKTALGESIMGLLLKLDTIQGVHSSMRDIRKSVARELVSLQEMLDTILIKQPESLVISEGESKTEDGSRNEDHCEELEPCEVSHEQATEPKEVTATSAAEEVGRHLSVSASEQNSLDEMGDSADKIDMVVEDVNALKEISEGAVMESEKLHDATNEALEDVDAVEEEVNNKAKEGETQIHEEFDSSVTEPLNEEAEDAEEVKPAQTENNKAEEDETQTQEFECSVAEPVKVEAPLNDEAEDAEEVKMASSENNRAKEDETQVTEPMKVEEAEEVKLAIPSTENKEDESRRRAMEDMEKMMEKMIESGKEQQQVVYNLNQKIKELEAKLAKQKEMKKKKKSRMFLRRGPTKSPVAKQP